MYSNDKYARWIAHGLRNERFERVAAAWPVRESCPGGEAALMSVIRESSRSRAPVLHMCCCNELPIPDYRPSGLSVPLTLARHSSPLQGGAAQRYRTSWKSSRAREEERTRAQTSAVRMQITAPRCNHASIWWSTIIRTILLRRLVNRRIARAFAFTQPAYRALLLFPQKNALCPNDRRIPLSQVTFTGCTLKRKYRRWTERNALIASKFNDRFYDKVEVEFSINENEDNYHLSQLSDFQNFKLKFY